MRNDATGMKTAKLGAHQVDDGMCSIQSGAALGIALKISLLVYIQTTSMLMPVVYGKSAAVVVRKVANAENVHALN